MVLVVVAVTCVLFGLLGLEFWWQENQRHQRDLARYLAVQARADALPALGPVFSSADASAALVLWIARTRPTVTILCAAASLAPLDDCLRSVQANLVVGDLAGRHGITHRPGITYRPGQVNFANGSRIMFRVDIDRRLDGYAPDVACWLDEGPAPKHFARLTRGVEPDYVRFGVDNRDG